jgi:hypothetical protein
MARPKTPRTQFNSMQQAAIALNIPIQHLKLIKKIYPDGFTSGNSVIQDKVLAFYNANKGMIEEKESESLESLNKQKLSNTVILQELEIQEKKKQIVLINDMEKFMGGFGLHLSTVMKHKITKELPPMVIGESEETVNQICADVYNSLMELVGAKATEWKTPDDQ